MGPLETALRAARDRGRKCLVPYLTGGLGSTWVDTVVAAASTGADAIEIGIPFSDPVMDGPTIQEANDRALSGGATPLSILSRLRPADVGVPMAAMTYYNIAYHMGHDRFATELVASGVTGAILPDLPLEEAGEWEVVAAERGVETVFLAAPTTPDERLPMLCERSHGFVYGVGLLGVTGVRDELAASAVETAQRLKAVTDLPVLVGVGVGTPEQAARVSEVADGVIVGSAMVRRLLEGGGADGIADLVGDFRSALDRG